MVNWLTEEGDICGLMLVDRCFRQWLGRQLGPINIGHLTRIDAGVGIIRDFKVIKQRFARIGANGNEYLQLPYPLDNLTDRENGIRDGEICVTE